MIIRYNELDIIHLIKYFLIKIYFRKAFKINLKDYKCHKTFNTCNVY